MTGPAHISPGYRFVSRTQAETGFCKAGHDLSAPGVARPRTANDPRLFCVPCGEERKKWCTLGLHKLPARLPGQKRVNCPSCSTSVRDRNLEKLPEYFRIDKPPEEVLDGAACDPRSAPLFDPADREDPEDRGVDHRQRVAWAKAICGGCPVMYQCLSWALKNRLTGVYGGQDLTLKTYRRIDAAREAGTTLATPDCA